MPDPRAFNSGGGVRYKLVTGTDPAANTEVSETVPAGVAWEVLVIWLSFVTDANAANRRVHLLLQDASSNQFFRLPAGADQTASTSSVYTYAAFGSHTNNAGHFQLAIPSELILPAGFKIVTTTTNRQVGDNYAAPILYVAEYNYVAP